MRFAIACFSLVTCFLLVSPAVAQDEARKIKRPNFVFILTDDQAPETLGCYGNQVCQTPNIDQLAKSGMRFTDAHHMGSWSGAVCTPSRTMIMTGRHVWNIPGVKGPGINKPADFRQKISRQSLPAIFNAAGYDTFRTCKKGNSFKEANALFKTVRDATRRKGTPENGSQWHGDQVMAYLENREKSNADDPFLIYFGFSHPHDPRDPPPELQKKYGAVGENFPTKPNPKAPPLPINYLPAHPFHHGHPGLRDEVNVKGVKRKRDEATIRNELGREYACIENIDHQIGRVIKKLKAMGEYDDTYIVFTSDHGIAVGRHGLAGKQNLYEHTWRVPMIIVGPGIKADSKASGFVYLMDVFPTFCDLAEIAAPQSCDGKSFRPVLKGKSDRIRDTMYGVYCGGSKPGMRSVKTADGWKLIKYNTINGEVRQTQLFNLKENPHELLVEHQAEDLQRLLKNQPQKNQVNLAGNAKHAAKLKEMEKLLQDQMTQHNDPYDMDKVYEYKPRNRKNKKQNRKRKDQKADK